MAFGRRVYGLGVMALGMVCLAWGDFDLGQPVPKDFPDRTALPRCGKWGPQLPRVRAPSQLAAANGRNLAALCVIGTRFRTKLRRNASSCPRRRGGNLRRDSTSRRRSTFPRSASTTASRKG